MTDDARRQSDEQLPASAGGSGRISAALAGNPNSGKTTLFNSLTGLRQKVANYPGVTVERKEGAWHAAGRSVSLIDLPGLYSLDAASPDERISRDVLTGSVQGTDRPDVVVAVVDATNLERHLYLVTQLAECGIPTVVAVTMMDLAESSQIGIDIQEMSRALGMPVVAVKAHIGEGLEALADAVVRAAEAKIAPRVLWGAEGEAADGDDRSSVKGRIFARYRFISEVFQKSVTHGGAPERVLTTRIDSVLTHRILGPLILVGVLLLLFQTIFSWASLPMDILDAGFGALGDWIRGRMDEGVLADLVVDGIISGVGGVLVFLPQILLMFMFISVLEDTGYMARAAFLLDRLMSRIGLHGKAFLPLISSFACAIPGIMATRTIENSRDRIATILIAPFMSCSARLPVYTLMIATFFADRYVLGFVSLGALMMLAMYGVGVLAAILAAYLLKKTMLRSEPSPFVMELPPYRMPKLRGVLQHMFTRASLFVKNAGTVILAISIVLWALTYFPRHEQVHSGDLSETAGAHRLEDSYAGRIGKTIEPVLEPLGFDWKIGVGLIASFAAREVFVSTMSIIYNVGGGADAESASLVQALRDEQRPDGSPTWTPLTAVTLMVFFVLAMQCMSTVAVVRRETNSWGWTGFLVLYMTGLAWVAAFVTYQGGKSLGY
jgi:ferrous iron transport protein B